jgi:hypothetical protein
MNIHPQAFNPSMGAERLTAGQPSGVGGSGDPVDTYFECITACSVDDGECVTHCVEVLRDAST